MNEEIYQRMLNALGYNSEALNLMIEHEKRTGRCFTMACKVNTDKGCEKLLDNPCPMLCMTTGVMGLGKGIELRRDWNG